MNRKKVVIVGGGPAGLMAATVLSEVCEVVVYEKEKTVGRKFLVAGNGGFNLTNDLIGDPLVNQYSPASKLSKALDDFDSLALRKWFEKIGIPTYVGSSGRVFPLKEIKPATVLKNWLAWLMDRGVQLHTNHTMESIESNTSISVSSNGKINQVKADFFLLALGGASWPTTGSDGNWTNSLSNHSIAIKPFQSSNCGVNIHWPVEFASNFSGVPLKNTSFSCGSNTKKGEALITTYGLEGNAIYPLIPAIREEFARGKVPILFIDLKPSLTIQNLKEKLKGIVPSTNNYAKVLNLKSHEMALLKSVTTKEDFLDPRKISETIKRIPLSILSLRPIEESISTVGGIPWDEIESNYALKKLPNFYVAGEMIDWDAPTGGFLLQGCFSTGRAAAKSIIEKISV